MRKLEVAVKDLKPPELYGPKKADLTIVSWGSTQAAVRDALPTLGDEGVKANSLEFCDLWPLRVEDAKKALLAAPLLLSVEGNYTGQFTRLLRAETGVEIENSLFKYDGEPFYSKEVVTRTMEVYHGS